MEVYCTRPRCPRPQNLFADLADPQKLRTSPQKYCTTCGMPLILRERYIPTKLLGRGGFGAAFLARDRDTPGMRRCVVKQFQPAADLNPAQMELAQTLFGREAEVLEDLGSRYEQIPNLFANFSVTVPSLQGGKQEQFFYLVQEYIDGQTLEEELAQKGRFTEAEVMVVLPEILKILKFVHDNGSIHRDIKPSNIMRDRTGKLFLLDFGAVKKVTNAPLGISGSSTGIYSQGFAPPEQMSGGEVYPSTDLYALAVTMLMLLTGMEVTKLFDSYNNQWKWRTDANVSDHLANILDRMLIAAPNQRFQSAQEVLNALNQPLTRTPDTEINIRTPASPTPTPQPTPTPTPVTYTPTQPTFSTIELLTGAAFSGFEGALIAITILSLTKSIPMTFGAALVILGILVFVQTKRWIEKFDLLIISGITLALVALIPLLHGASGILQVLVLAVAGGLIAIAIAALFRLIHKLLSSLL
jgi:serine/threonine protein kinase